MFFCKNIFSLQLLSGNTDSHKVKVSYLEHPVTARFLRLHVQAWHNHPNLKMDIIGCQSMCFICKEEAGRGLVRG